MALPGLVRLNAHLYRIYPSPTEQYRFDVYWEPKVLFGPGDGIGYPGYVKVVDGYGDIFDEENLDEIQNVRVIRWDRDAVHFTYTRHGVEYESALNLPT
jgi:hypothetical protein